MAFKMINFCVILIIILIDINYCETTDIQNKYADLLEKIVENETKIESDCLKSFNNNFTNHERKINILIINFIFKIQK